MRNRRKVMQGRVVSDKMAKTVIVEIEERSAHPLYGKVVTHAHRFKAHNVEPTVAKMGDLVKITEARPISSQKRWLVTEIVQRGVVVEQVVDVELEELRAKEDADRAARRVEQERRAAERLSKLAGEDEQVASESAEGDASASAEEAE
jgi:small subunit ribosomal protein S17